MLLELLPALVAAGFDLFLSYAAAHQANEPMSIRRCQLSLMTTVDHSIWSRATFIFRIASVVSVISVVLASRYSFRKVHWHLQRDDFAILLV